MLEISSPSHPAWAPFSAPDRPLAPGETDWFNSTVNTFGQRRPDSDASPNYLANLDQDIALVQRDDHSLLSYRVPSMNARIQAYLRPHEAAVVEVAVARIRGETPPPAAYATVQGWLGRLAPAIG